jgi:hypothetical protein
MMKSRPEILGQVPASGAGALIAEFKKASDGQRNNMMYVDNGSPHRRGSLLQFSLSALFKSIKLVRLLVNNCTTARKAPKIHTLQEYPVC